MTADERPLPIRDSSAAIRWQHFTDEEITVIQRGLKLIRWYDRHDESAAKLREELDDRR